MIWKLFLRNPKIGERDTGVPRIEGFKDILELRASEEKKKTYHEQCVNIRSISNRDAVVVIEVAARYTA